MIRSIYSLDTTLLETLYRRFQNCLFPLTLALLYSISFGWALPSLGYYLDDWPHIFYQKQGGSEAINLFHAYDGRPLLGWFYIFSSDLLGFDPTYRQIFALILRYLVVIIFWLVFRLIWQNLRWQVDAIALLFSVYPIFAQQAVSVAFSSHWAAFLCLMLSFYTMLLALKYEKIKFVLITISILFNILQYTLSEYFVAVDLFRFLLIYYYAKNNIFSKDTTQKKIVWVFRYYFPYLLVVVGFVVWRLFLLELPTTDRIAPVYLQELLSAPAYALQNLINWVVRDFFLNFIICWYKTFTVEMFDFQSRFGLALLGLTLILILIIVLFLSLRHRYTNQASLSWAKQGLMIGFLFTLFAPLPAWVTGRSSSMFVGPMSDRFGLPAMFGVSVLMIALIEILFRRPSYQILITAIFIGLATGWQARNTNDFRWSWIFQQRFFHQLTIRIPYLLPNSLISSEQEFLPKVGGYPLSYMLNLLYANDNPDNLKYYYVNLSKEYQSRIDDFAKGEVVFRQRWQSRFIGDTTAGVVVEYRPEDGTCLWIVDESVSHNPFLPEITRRALLASDLSRIIPDSHHRLANEIFGQPTIDSWCEIYQKASLAAQLKDWDQVIQLWDLSKPYHGQINASTELKPFIEAYLRKGNLTQSLLLSQQLNQGVRGGAASYLCSIWANALNTNLYPEAANYLKEWNCEFLEGK
ncbi:MAG TPA: hypothetical protein DCE76_00970 [Anaerolineaceae bacterium]|nr:hypothetical protein [Anaerolineaceae bacterium]